MIQSESDAEPRMATMIALFLWSVTSANGVWQTPFRNDDIWRSLGLSRADAKNAAVFFQSHPSPTTSRVLKVYSSQFNRQNEAISEKNTYTGNGMKNDVIRSKNQR